MKLYLNADGERERIVPLWCDAMWQRKIWCFFKGHEKAPTVTFSNNKKPYKTTCGICCKEL